MALSHSPLIVTDGLVFMYDTGNRKSYVGEPTVNLTTDSPSQGGWNGSLNVLDSSTKKFRFNVSNFSGSPGQGWRSFTWDLNSYSGQSVTISATVEVPSASPGTFAWIMMGQGNTHTNTSGAGGYMGYSAASERIQKTTTTTEHITWSGTVGSTGTASQPSGHVGFTVWYNDGTPSTNSYVEVSNVQIEIKSHATQFVNGTRSATQGLLDLTNNATIDISNTSFDSDAQMTFDGTDDKVVIANFPHVWNSSLTLEAVVSWNDDSRSVILGNYNVGANDINFEKLTSRKLRFYWNRGERDVVTSSNVVTTSGDYHHVVFTRGTTFRIYVDGVLVTESSGIGTNVASTGSTFRVGGDTRNGATIHNGNIPVLKVYNQALTADEVLQNYNATKGRFS